ncbi:restriction endonuclease subunit S [Klebsiella aerogenes]|uniref:restriction endonuclease subunit S n=1 Tax=Klebsiella aerogenes TaxID=548 RepID=UPI001F47DE4E|nr:restriction endonuclease subunit S [Klebsiella aerogenes]MDN3812527.1 restriction endonuclease subunit S [Klebsiella aerogenes]HCB3607970.1 restriction endonuclease subunit S [Klebsiella aerogenes]HDU3768705.1 restriction endonuclease subunit S [Klebsiella aerogenes]HDU4641364.1 restriction endonuclease subunit S [Klebsiella aerogenes]HDU5280804.1 restriction endonuclease subunit S [Klebsiella aerogenes]
MAKYKAYPEYKDSGVEWFDVRPLSWKVTRLKLETFMNMGQSPSSDDCNIEGDGLAFLQGNAEFGKVNPIEKQYCPVPKKIANPGDILFSVRAPVGAMNFADKKYGIGRGLCSIAASAKLTSPFLWWLLPTYKYQLDTIATGSTFEAVSAEQLGNLCFALPSISEQSQIAAFLDHETAKIDNLIEKQQQLIELLKEKRQAVISHAVTKGLNPDVPMKDSGVEWLGKVPEHWTIAQLKFNTIEMQTGPFGSQLHAEDYVVDGIPLINPAHMNAGMIIPDPKVTVDEATQERLGRHKLSEGEIIFSRRGELGRCAVVKKNNEGWLCGTGSLKAKLTKKIIPDYAYTLISSEGVVSELTLESKGSTMANLNTETLGRIRLPVPPISEQEAILDYIKIISDKYDYLIRSADTAIRLMQERRTALISAAVTGKIDVRDWVAPDTQNVEEPQEATA